MSIPVGQVIYEMIDGLLGSIESSSLSRIDVIFNIEERYLLFNIVILTQ